jgi:hypothetical protein
MFVKIGTLEIREPDLTKVYSRGMGSSGFEFEGLAPEERGKHIVDRLEAIKTDEALDCEAETNDGRRMSGYGKLEKFQGQITETAPVMYRFSGGVTLLR